MGITRRRFLGYAAGAATVGLRGGPLDLWPLGRSVEMSRSCVLLDLKAHGCLSEAVSGYESVLTSAGVRWMRAEARSVSPARGAVLIVPAALEIPPAAVQAIVSYLQAGATVILESGAGFAAGREFCVHRVELRDYLQVRVEAPVQLWSAHTSSQGIPYVDYSWLTSARSASGLVTGASPPSSRAWSSRPPGPCRRRWAHNPNASASAA